MFWKKPASEFDEKIMGLNISVDENTNYLEND